MRMLMVAIMFVPAAVLVPAAAAAHAQLRQSDPPVGGTVQAAPREVEITYSEAVEPRFSSIVVTDAAGAVMDKHDVHTAPGDGKRLVVGVGALPPGTYRVEWHATSVDTHKTEGTFSFTVAP